MLVDPGGIASGGMDHTEERVRSNEVPGIHFGATQRRITLQLPGVEGGDSALGECGSGGATVELRIVNVDTLIVVGGCAGRRCVRSAESAGQAGAGFDLRGIQRTVVGYVVVEAGGLRRSAGSQRGHSGKR